MTERGEIPGRVKELRSGEKCAAAAGKSPGTDSQKSISQNHPIKAKKKTANNLRVS